MIMHLKKLLFQTKDKIQIDLDNVKEYPTHADLMREQNLSCNDTNTVHRRRDLDSLG